MQSHERILTKDSTIEKNIILIKNSNRPPEILCALIIFHHLHSFHSNNFHSIYSLITYMNMLALTAIM